MADKKRKRGQNFSVEDKDKIIKLLMQHKDTILNKKTDGASNDAKSEAWISVTDAFNSSSTTHRNKDSLMKLWEKMKSDSKIYYARMRSNTTQTGGGPSMIKTDPVLEQVCSILGRGCTGILGVSDCDAETGPEQNSSLCEVYLIHDDLWPPVQEKAERKILEENVTIAVEGDNVTNAVVEDKDTNGEEEEIDTNAEEVQVNKVQKLQHNKNTSLWSRRRPRVSTHNERSEATSIISSSISNVYKRKETVEDLKENLLRDELAFKKKFYDLQLQAAAIDVEIKTTILEQIRDGRRTESNIYH